MPMQLQMHLLLFGIGHSFMPGYGVPEKKNLQSK